MQEDFKSWLAGILVTSNDSAIQHLGIEVAGVEGETISLRMPITAKVLQPFGLLHGGANLLLAETAASLHACWGVDLDKMIPVGIEVSASHVRSATSGWVLAEGRVIRRSKRLIVHQVDVFLEEPRQLLSSVRVTNFYKLLGGE